MARRCVVTSIGHGEPFVLEQQLPERDGIIAYALVGAIAHGMLVVYRADYDVPSRISISGIDNLRLFTCRGATLQPCSNDLSKCVHCDSEDEFASCSLFRDYSRGRPL